MSKIHLSTVLVEIGQHYGDNKKVFTIKKHQDTGTKLSNNKNLPISPFPGKIKV